MLYIDSPGEKRTGIKEVKDGITVRDAVERATRKPAVGAGSITVEDMSGMHRRISASLKDLVINGVPALQIVASAPASAVSTRKAVSAALEFMGALMWNNRETKHREAIITPAD
jgi:hypothetical protein